MSENFSNAQRKNDIEDAEKWREVDELVDSGQASYQGARVMVFGEDLPDLKKVRQQFINEAGAASVRVALVAARNRQQ